MVFIQKYYFWVFLPIIKVLYLVGGTLSVFFCYPNPLHAQIVPDQTLPIHSKVTTNGNNIVIDSGTRAGTNLFHSFESFSLTKTNRAIFNTAPAIENIIGRITGKSISNIDGVISVNSNANLLLVNPNGIVFGPNANLDLGGSFLATTARGIQFQDGTLFNTTNSKTPPLLTISRPTGLQFKGLQSRGIVVQGRLAVPPSQTLALVGGNIEFNGGQANAESGRIELGSVNKGIVNLSPANSGWRLGYHQVQSFSDIDLLSKSAILNPNAVSNPLGGIQLQGRQINLNQSQILAQTLGDQPGADINIQATQSLTVSGEFESFFPFSSWIANVVESGANGKGGKIIVSVPNLSMQEGGRIQTLSIGNGAAGNIQVNAHQISLTGGASPNINDSRDFGDNLNTRISSEAFSQGNSGNINIATDTLALTEGGRITTVVGPFASGTGGDIFVHAAQSIFGKEVNPFEIDSSSNISAITFGFGDGGNVRVSTPSLHLQDGAQISTRGIKISFGNQGFSPGAGNVGNVTVDTSQSVKIAGASKLAPDFVSFLGSITNGTGRGGDVTVHTRKLSVEDGGILASAVFSSTINSGPLPPDIGKGNGGNLLINVAESANVIGISPNPFNPAPSVIGTFTLSEGNAGDTTINTQKLTVLDGGQVTTGTLASGNSGRLLINASESILVNGTDKNGLPAQVASNTLLLNEATRNAFFLPSKPTGNTGEIIVNTGQLTITDGGRIGTQHIGSGNAGALSVKAHSILLDNQGAIIAETASGEGGNIDLSVNGILQLRHHSRISTESKGIGNGGNIQIDTKFLITSPFENSDIIANAFDGNGGNIQITTQGIFGFSPRAASTPFSDITASSEQGIDGVVDINNPEVDPSQSIVALPEDVKSPQDIAQGCRPGQALGGSSFVDIGRGGLPPGPESLTPQTVWQDLRTHNQQTSNTTAKVKDRQTLIATKPSTHLVEAQGWRKDPHGRIYLTTNAPNILHTMPSSTTCGKG